MYSTSVPESPTKTVLQSSFSEVTMTHQVTVTHAITRTHDVIVTRTVPVTQNVYKTYSVTATVTDWVTSNVTVVHTSTKVVRCTPTFANFSLSNDTDPVQELIEIGEQALERKKALTKISVYEKRTSAKYMGYVAIIFIVCSVGSMVAFDMLSICQKAKCCQGKNGQKMAYHQKGSKPKKEKGTVVIDWVKMKDSCERKKKEAEEKMTTVETFGAHEGKSKMPIIPSNVANACTNDDNTSTSEFATSKNTEARSNEADRSSVMYPTAWMESDVDVETGQILGSASSSNGLWSKVENSTGFNGQMETVENRLCATDEISIKDEIPCLVWNGVLRWRPLSWKLEGKEGHVGHDNDQVTEKLERSHDVEEHDAGIVYTDTKVDETCVGRIDTYF